MGVCVARTKSPFVLLTCCHILWGSPVRLSLKARLCVLHWGSPVCLHLLEVHLYIRRSHILGGAPVCPSYALRCTCVYVSHLEPECHLYAHLTPGSSQVDLYVCLTPYGWPVCMSHTLRLTCMYVSHLEVDLYVCLTPWGWPVRMSQASVGPCLRFMRHACVCLTSWGSPICLAL